MSLSDNITDKEKELEQLLLLKTEELEKHKKEQEVALSLERVRDKAIEMRSSKDISDATAVVFNELSKLGVEMDRCGIATYTDTPIMKVWSTPLSPEDKQVIEVVHGDLDYRFNSLLIEVREAWENKQEFFTRTYEGDEVKEYYTHLLEAPDYHFPVADEYPEKHVANMCYFKQGFIFIWTQFELTEEVKEILKRFTKEFSRTYTRYLDLKKAEAQARESQIEAALERVRAKAMAMHSSNDISEATAVVFNELTRLGIEMERCGIGIFKHDSPIIELWSTPLSPDTKKVVEVITGNLDSSIHPLLQGIIKSWKTKEDYYRYELKKEEVKPYYDLLEKAPGYKFPKTEVYNHRQINNVFFFNEGGVFAFTKDELTEEAKQIFKRFTNVFSLTYHRYLDIVRAETQAREAQVEASLERVRARALAMHSSKDISDATAIVFNELTRLGIDMVRAGIVIFDDKSPVAEVWSTRLSPKDKQVTDIVTGNLNFEIHPMLQSGYRDWKDNKNFTTYELTGNEIRKYYELLAQQPGYHFPKTDKYPERQIVYGFFHDEVNIFAYTEEDLTEEQKKIFHRFAKVFSHTYRRYQDLMKAETQAREAQVEASLERVRAKAMAMHSSRDIPGAVAIVFNELNKLGIEMQRSGIVIITEETPVMEVWSTPLVQKGKLKNKVVTGKLDSRIHPMLRGVYAAWQQGDKYYSYILKGDEVRKYYELLGKVPDYRFPEIKKYADQQINHSFFFNEGQIFAFTKDPLPEEKKQIFFRFTNVFSHTYRRYIDIVKAEKQAREAEIEASLERVRAKAMAMHSSEDISGATAVVFNELIRLGVEMERCGIAIFNNPPIIEIWSTPLSKKNKKVEKVITGRINSDIHPMLQKSSQEWKNKNEFFSYELKGDEVKKYYKILKNEPDYKFPEVKSYPNRQILNSFNNSEGSIFVYSENKLSDDTKQIIHRFSKVFSLTYKRYMDLVHAEKQAREAQIEASLERVRAKAMAMHNSEDISGATAIVFDELTRLGITMERCGIVILNETPIMEVWSTLLSPESKKVVEVISGKLDSKMHVMLQEVYKAWRNNKEFFAYTLDGDEVRNYYDKLEKEPGYHFPKVANYPHQQIANCFYFNEGYVFAYTVDELTDDEKHVFQRFTSVFSLTYRRYLDLIKAEAQAREAIKQASLNRVRGEIASMRNAEDLKRITPVIWRELKELEVPFIRCGVFIISEETETIRAHLSTPSGKALAVLDLNFNENKLTKNLVLFRNKNEVYKIHWNKTDFIRWMKSMMKSGQVQSAEKYQGSADAPESLHLHFIPFKQGMLYVGNTVPLSEDELKLANSLSQSFSVAYARYADFKNLEVAKEQIEKTLDELKAAQTQLVHSEKMASLGELTAGIAHEIQNPLNFVNNFSELSNELLDELKEEMDNGNNDEVKELADDVIQNLKKINHHGKRAESIIKGMLLHSRGSSDQKEATDINTLCDEYLRLSYHGFRAKDKSFNADFQFIPDEKLPKVSVIPQDIGRVLLNLINNAFHVVDKKAKAGIDGFKPEVVIQTAVVSSKDKRRKAIRISVKDNGDGIPEKIKDKIFQPFFTTKPTGEGTGLGLSISYDIITKGHDGELKFETKEGEGTVFIISLWIT